MSRVIQALIPLPTSPALINNYLVSYSNPRLTYIPATKIDYQLSPKTKISGYYSRTYTDTPSNAALPQPISSATASNIIADTARPNVDQTITPTLILHVGIGLVDTTDNVIAPNYDVVSKLGLKGTFASIFPSIQAISGAQGGMANMGPGSIEKLVNLKPTANTSLTWVRGNHTYKAGGELIVEGYPATNQTYANAWMIFSTRLPYHLTYPNLDPGQVPLPGIIASPSQQIDQNAGKPARTVQWSVGVQREITKNILAEAAYVGNRGVWWNSANIICPNCLTQDILSKVGLSLNSADDLRLLGSPLNSPYAISRGFGNAPYPGFPMTQSVVQALRP